MSHIPSGPNSADWLSALLRGLHPLRWALCLAGLCLTAVSAVMAQSLFEQTPPHWSAWWEQPVEQAHGLWMETVDRSLGGTLLRGLPLLALNSALWCLVGGWITRHELLARLVARSGTSDPFAEPGATAFVLSRWKHLLLVCPMVILFSLLLLLPVVLAGRVNAWFGGAGAVGVSLFLPVILMVNTILMFLLLGVLGWPLMPCSLAAECSDRFDALSRAHTYLFQHLFRFLVLTSITIGVAGLPLVGVLSALAETLAALPAVTAKVIIWLAAALSGSIFWSLLTLVYLDLRTATDSVDAAELAEEPSPDRSLETPPAETPPAEAVLPLETPRPGVLSLVSRTIQILATQVGSWYLTVWLFARTGGDQAEWLAWGMGERFVPPAQGFYLVASRFAAFWGVGWLLLPVWMGLRRHFRSQAPTPGE